MSELNLTYEKKTVFEKCDKSIAEKAFEYAEGYKTYLDNSKTERESVDESIRMAEANGFKPYNFGMPLRAGDRYYYNNRGKNLFLFIKMCYNMRAEGFPQTKKGWVLP